MSFQDLTHARLTQLANMTKDFYEDLHELIKSKTESSYGDFSTARQIEQSRESAIKYPSNFFSYHDFDKFIEVRRQGKSNYYVVFTSGIDFNDSQLELIQSRYDLDVQHDFHEYTFYKNFNFDYIQVVFDFILKVYLKVLDFEQSVFIF